ncbi:hypothetical protein GDO78_003912 [Eleutherodactylus coqui]|uniref:Leucine-rich repeat-containing G-protein coupled receptor 4 n=1 Tax=Eleutherodactylus coqui TaxID=57060 RepID=A0A8J6ETP7_ELECQ|nr:hypothetical protein GDO78_003912 [Eleutherodactylus coqui]
MMSRPGGLWALLLLLVSPSSGGPSGVSSPPPCPVACRCNAERGVDCSGRGLTAVPDGLSVFTNMLDISMNNITKLPEGAFKGLPYLVELRLDANHIVSVPDDSFEGLVQLRHLWLDDNSLTEVPVRPLGNLPSLQALTLALNKITHIPDYAFSNLSSLVVLHLHNNKIKTLGPHCFDGLDSLEALDLSRNSISRIHHDAFSTLASISKLDLSFNQLSSFPPGGLHGLTQLKLTGNPTFRDSLSAKDFLKLQSVSVPYAYQCCAFSACDSYMTSPAEDDGSKYQKLLLDHEKGAIEDYMISEEVKDHVQTVVHCNPSTGAFKPCEFLLGSWMIRLTVWFIFLLAVIFNVIVIMTMFASCSTMSSSKLFIGLIAICNLFMGIYTGILTVLDTASWGQFAEFGIWWETGSGCKVAGFLAIFSSESAIFFLTLAAIERSLSAKDIIKKEKSQHLKKFQIASVVALFLAIAAGCLPLFHVGEFSSSPLCLPFPTGETPSLGFTVTLVLLNSLAFLVMVITYTKLYCTLEKEDLSENAESSMIKHVAWLIFTNCIFFCPVAFFSFAPLITAISITPEIMKSVTLIFFPLPACLNPVLYVFFNPKFKEDWKLLRWHLAKKRGSVAVATSAQRGCVTQDFYYDFGMYSHLQGNYAVCDYCESVLLKNPPPCKHLIKSHSCPTLAVVPCHRSENYWSDIGTQSAHSDCADEEDSFVSDSSDQVQACGRACFYQSRGFPLVRYAYNIPRMKD